MTEGPLSAAQAIERELLALQNDEKAAHLSRFFKCGRGQYGEGDKFLGIPVPITRACVKAHWRHADETDVETLTASPWHEVRLAGFLLLVRLFEQAGKEGRERRQNYLTGVYIKLIPRGNNWDLVDLIAPKILGRYALEHPSARFMLHLLAGDCRSLWRQRVGVVATLALIRGGVYEDTFRICATLLNHSHDLIHKACGWMLREAGKHGAQEKLIIFLTINAPRMPRTMLRYAIERFPEPLRRRFLAVPHRQEPGY